MGLVWRKAAQNDRKRIARHIMNAGGVQAALKLDAEFATKAEAAAVRPKLYAESRRMRGSREIVVRPNYVMVYRVTDDAVIMLRVLHARQQWPTTGTGRV